MGFQSLVRRKAQLALLAAACDKHEPVRLYLRENRPDGDLGEHYDSHFVALQPDGLLLDWQGRPAPRGPVRVRFGHCGQQFVLDAMARGVLDLPSGASARTAVKLGLPLRLQRRNTRETVRLSFESGPPVIATFHGVLDSRLCFEARVLNVSIGGLAIQTDEPSAASIEVGEMCWTEFVLPEGHGTFQFVVRLIHKEIRAGGEIVLGWTITPGEDGCHAGRHHARLEEYLANANSRATKGGESCLARSN